jgi:hypothetical protein
MRCIWNVMAHMQKPDFVFRRNGRVHLNRRRRQFSRLLAAEVCVSAVMLDTPCSEVVWKVLATHSIRQFPLHFPFRASPCAITFQLDCTLFCFESTIWRMKYSFGGISIQKFLEAIFSTVFGASFIVCLSLCVGRKFTVKPLAVWLRM